MEPAVRQRLGCRSGILQIALHDDVAPEHHLAERRPIRRHRLQGGGIEHHQLLQRRMIGAGPSFYVRHLIDRWAGRAEALGPEAVADYVAQFRDPAVVTAACEDYRAGAGLDREHDLADREARRRIACPVLMVWGRGYSASAASPASVWRAWAGQFEEAALVCGHFLADERSEECAKALLDFFRT